MSANKPRRQTRKKAKAFTKGRIQNVAVSAEDRTQNRMEEHIDKHNDTSSAPPGPYAPSNKARENKDEMERLAHQLVTFVMALAVSIDTMQRVHSLFHEDKETYSTAAAASRYSNDDTYAAGRYTATQTVYPGSPHHPNLTKPVTS